MDMHMERHGDDKGRSRFEHTFTSFRHSESPSEQHGEDDSAFWSLVRPFSASVSQVRGGAQLECQPPILTAVLKAFSSFSWLCEKKLRLFIGKILGACLINEGSRQRRQVICCWINLRPDNVVWIRGVSNLKWMSLDSRVYTLLVSYDFTLAHFISYCRIWRCFRKLFKTLVLDTH